MNKKLHVFSMDRGGTLFLDEKELGYVTGYKLVSHADSPAELTITMHVKIGQIAFEPERQSLVMQCFPQDSEM